MQPLTRADGPSGAVHGGLAVNILRGESQAGAEQAFSAQWLLLSGAGAAAPTIVASLTFQIPGPLMWLLLGLSLPVT